MAKSAPRNSAPSKSKRSVNTRILRTAKQRFGFDSLRPGQQEAVEAILNGQDTLVVAPTGSGKSAIYQIAGLLLEGSVLVVSPLIALQKDQVDSIQEQGLDDSAVVINSTIPVAELKGELAAVAEDASKFIFLAPEQLAKSETVDRLKSANLALFVVDEAHCVSEWGHDFRPDYLRLGHVVAQLDHPTVLGLTATAAPPVRSEVVERLGMRDAQVLVGSFDRPNIFLRVDRFKDQPKKLEALLHRVRWADKPGIIYVATRKEAESIMAGLEEEGISAGFYHGGLKASERDKVQDQFMSGDLDVMVATNAFGMGIDKENIRFVYHFDAPDSLDAYYQEIGRAGRDGEQAEAILFFREQDIGSQAFHTGSARVDAEAFEQIANALAEAGGSLSKEEISEATGLSTRKLSGTLQQMIDNGALAELKSGNFRLPKKADIAGAAEAASDQQQKIKDHNRQRLEDMRAYADATTCRRAILLRYFGDESPEMCNRCDVCEAKSPESAVESSAGTRMEVA